MSNKDKFMEYVKIRIREKAYKRRKAEQELYETYVAGYERCSRGKWRAGQR